MVRVKFKLIETEMDGRVLGESWNSEIYLQFTNLEERVDVVGRDRVWGGDVEDRGRETDKGKSRYNRERSAYNTVLQGDDHKTVLHDCHNIH